MKTYKIPVIWSCYGFVNIQAENLEEAIELAEEAPLPDGDYIDDSFEIDLEGIPVHNDKATAEEFDNLY